MDAVRCEGDPTATSRPLVGHFLATQLPLLATFWPLSGHKVCQPGLKTDKIRKQIMVFGSLKPLLIKGPIVSEGKAYGRSIDINTSNYPIKIGMTDNAIY